MTGGVETHGTDESDILQQPVWTLPLPDDVISTSFSLAAEKVAEQRPSRFWAHRLRDSREGTCWQDILQTLVCYRLIDPGSEWRLHRQWFEQSAMGDLLGADDALVEKNALYRCLDKRLPRLAQQVTAPRGRLVRRKICIKRDVSRTRPRSP